MGPIVFRVYQVVLAVALRVGRHVNKPALADSLYKSLSYCHSYVFMRNLCFFTMVLEEEKLQFRILVCIKTVTCHTSLGHPEGMPLHDTVIYDRRSGT